MSRKSGLLAVIQMCGYAFEISLRDIDMLRTVVVERGPDTLIRPGTSRFYGCVEKRLPMVLYWSQLT